MLSNDPYFEVFRLTPLPTVLLLVEDGVVTIAEANPAYLDLIGTKPTAITNKNFITWIKNEAENPNFYQYSTEIGKSVSRVLKTNERSSLKLNLKSVEILNTPIFDKNGKLEYILHVVKPIGIQQTTEKLLSLIISNTEEAFIVLNKDLLVTTFNEQFYRLYLFYFGIEVAEGESILTYAQPNRENLLRALYQNVLEGNVEHSLIDIELDSEIKKISLKYSPITDEHQEVIGVFVTAADVTAITNFEVQLKTREQELSLIFDNLTEIIFLLTVEFLSIW